DRVSANVSDVGRSPAGLDTQVVPDAPAQYGQPLQERSEAGLPYRIIGKCRQEHADAPYPLALLLRMRCERPCSRRAAKQRDELAAPHVEHRGGLQPPRVATGQTAIAMALDAVMVVTGWSISPASAGDG